MGNAERKRWNKAARLAFLAMGKSTRKNGRRNRTVWNADEDPLAWWCLTQAIFNI